MFTFTFYFIIVITCVVKDFDNFLIIFKFNLTSYKQLNTYKLGSISLLKSLTVLVRVIVSSISFLLPVSNTKLANCTTKE